MDILRPTEMQAAGCGEGAEAEAGRELVAATEAKCAAHLLERAAEPEAAMQHYIKTIGCGLVLAGLRAATHQGSRVLPVLHCSVQETAFRGAEWWLLSCMLHCIKAMQGADSGTCVGCACGLER